MTSVGRMEMEEMRAKQRGEELRYIERGRNRQNAEWLNDRPTIRIEVAEQTAHQIRK